MDLCVGPDGRDRLWPRMARMNVAESVICAAIVLALSGSVAHAIVPRLQPTNDERLCDYDLPELMTRLREHRAASGGLPASLEIDGLGLRAPTTPWGVPFVYQRIGTGARVFASTPRGSVEAWIYDSGRTVVTGCQTPEPRT